MRMRINPEQISFVVKNCWFRPDWEPDPDNDNECLEWLRQTWGRHIR